MTLRCDHCEFWIRMLDDKGECNFGGKEPRVRFVIRKFVHKPVECCPNFGVWTPLGHETIPEKKEDFEACLHTPNDWFCADFQEKIVR